MDRHFVPRASRRRWRVPPAPVHLAGALEGACALEEVPGELGFVLRQALRDLALWTSAPAEGRARLFAAGAERSRLGPVLAALSYPELEAPLRTLSALVARPTAARPEMVALVCREVSQWADGHGALRTALAFAECAAAVAPGDAGTAYAAARLARRSALPARAEEWYMRAVVLGRQRGDWSSYAFAMLGLGHLRRQQGSLRQAERCYQRSLRAARRNALGEAQGLALHFLFVNAAEGGDMAGAERHAAEALRAYGDAHHQLPRLAHDLGHFWTLQGHFSRALPVFEALLPHFPGPVERLLVLGSLARAAGGAGDTERFARAWAEAWTLAHSAAGAESAASALLDLAHGALGLDRRDLVETAARRALEIAAGRGEAQLRAQAEALLAASSVEVPALPAGCAEGDALATELVRSLGACVPRGAAFATSG